MSLLEMYPFLKLLKIGKWSVFLLWFIYPFFSLQIMADPNLEEGDIEPAPKLIEVVFQNCKGQVDHWVEPYLTISIERLHRSETAYLKCLLIQVVRFLNISLFIHIHLFTLFFVKGFPVCKTWRLCVYRSFAWLEDWFVANTLISNIVNWSHFFAFVPMRNRSHWHVNEFKMYNERLWMRLQFCIYLIYELGVRCL